MISQNSQKLSSTNFLRILYFFFPFSHFLVFTFHTFLTFHTFHKFLKYLTLGFFPFLFSHLTLAFLKFLTFHKFLKYFTLGFLHIFSWWWFLHILCQSPHPLYYFGNKQTGMCSKNTQHTESKKQHSFGLE